MPQQHIEDFCEDKARAGDGQFAIAFALMQLARHQKSVAYNLRCLGNGDATTSMGAIEGLSVKLDEGMRGIADAIQAVADRE